MVRTPCRARLRRRAERDDELRAVRVGTRVCHRENAGGVVPEAQAERLVLEALRPVDRVAALPVLKLEVATLQVLPLDDAMDRRAAVPERLTRVAEPVVLVRTKPVEVRRRKRHVLQEEGEHQPHGLLGPAVDHEVEVDLVALLVGPAGQAVGSHLGLDRAPVLEDGHPLVAPHGAPCARRPSGWRQVRNLQLRLPCLLPAPASTR